MAIYVDTSALAKRYLLERGSEAFDAFLQQCEDDCVISPLGSTEFESILQRLRRERLIDADYAEQARKDFQADLHTALWVVRPFAASTFAQAADLMRSLDVPLATLDALHLATAIELGCQGFATSDRQLSRAASRRGLTVHDFSE
jgi:predicted nucleic acid-binding protein